MSNLITNEEFIPVQTSALNSIQQGSLGTINGQSIENGSDVTLDLSLYTIVSKLPTENIKDNKIYMLRNTNVADTQKDIFDEYLYNSTDNKWELLGHFRSTIDLKDYLKTTVADKKYVKVSTNAGTSINTDKNGALSNFSDNGQAYLAVR